MKTTFGTARQTRNRHVNPRSLTRGDHHLNSNHLSLQQPPGQSRRNQGIRHHRHLPSLTLMSASQVQALTQRWSLPVNHPRNGRWSGNLVSPRTVQMVNCKSTPRTSMKMRTSMRTWWLAISNQRSDPRLVLRPDRRKDQSSLMQKKWSTVSKCFPCHPIALSVWIDPFLRLLDSPPPQEGSPSGNGTSPSGDTEKVFRETSIRRNRRQKFIDCLSKDNVDMGMCPFPIGRNLRYLYLQPSYES